MRKPYHFYSIFCVLLMTLGINQFAGAETTTTKTTIVAPAPMQEPATAYVPATPQGATTTVIVTTPAATANNFMLAVSGSGSNIATLTNSSGQNIAQGYGGSAAVSLNPQPTDGAILLLTVSDPANTTTCHIVINSMLNGGYFYNDAQYPGDNCAGVLPPLSVTKQPNNFVINPGQAANSGVTNTQIITTVNVPTVSKFILSVGGAATNSATLQTLDGKVLASGNTISGPQNLQGNVGTGDTLLLTVTNGTVMSTCHIDIIDAQRGGYTYNDNQYPSDNCSQFLPATAVTRQEGQFIIAPVQAMGTSL